MKRIKINPKAILIIIIACINSFILPALLLLIMRITLNFFLAGICYLIFALYQYIGYILKWKHVYCSYQLYYHEKMTPDLINWEHIKKRDALGIPVISAVFGVFSMLLGILQMTGK